MDSQEGRTIFLGQEAGLQREQGFGYGQQGFGYGQQQAVGRQYQQGVGYGQQQEVGRQYQQGVGYGQQQDGQIVGGQTVARGPSVLEEEVPGERTISIRQTGESREINQTEEEERKYAVRPIITVEKFVEVPQIITKEIIRKVAKPEIVERVTEVPLGWGAAHQRETETMYGAQYASGASGGPAGVMGVGGGVDGQGFSAGGKGGAYGGVYGAAGKGGTKGAAGARGMYGAEGQYAEGQYAEGQYAEGQYSAAREMYGQGAQDSAQAGETVVGADGNLYDAEGTASVGLDFLGFGQIFDDGNAEGVFGAGGISGAFGEQGLGRYFSDIYGDAEYVQQMPGRVVSVTGGVYGASPGYVADGSRGLSGPPQVEPPPQLDPTQIRGARVVGLRKLTGNDTIDNGPPVQLVEQAAPTMIVEETVKRVPREEVVERVFTIPKVEYRDIIEYEDVVEYREVFVDKYVEVPEIEYRTREVEVYVPQMFIQPVYEDKYVDVPVLQVQEVERIETQPIFGPREATVTKVGNLRPVHHTFVRYTPPVTPERERKAEGAKGAFKGETFFKKADVNDSFYNDKFAGAGYGKGGTVFLGNRGPYDGALGGSQRDYIVDPASFNPFNTVNAADTRTTMQTRTVGPSDNPFASAR